ncbi:hypothetical protein [Actinomadura rupiterrae]|uniref:hypothetical protein n=1 Tax=Actinomadura rupiterrae TaxID=559627 RepID=UPI0020A493B5|nr:hypothetical protein [Actinomadura rupiterrae]MCP2337654.1 hypothetical protein [Actinomadura rupiterrae]
MPRVSSGLLVAFVRRVLSALPGRGASAWLGTPEEPDLFVRSVASSQFVPFGWRGGAE